MRRALVLTEEGARHSFRATLPAHVFEPYEIEGKPSFWRLTASDIRGFATTYFACLAAALVFIF